MKLFGNLRESTLYRGAYLMVSLAVLFLDQWTKGVVTRTLEVHQSRSVVADVFDLTYVRNTGAAFGLFASVDSSSSKGTLYFFSATMTRSRGNIDDPAMTVAGAMPLTRTSGPRPMASSRIR